MEDLGGDPEARARLLERLGDLMYVTGVNVAQGIDYLETALKLWVEAGNESRVARTHSRLANYLSTVQNFDVMDIPRAREHLAAAERVLSEGPEGTAMGLLYVGKALAAINDIQTEEGLEASRRAMEIGERLGNEVLWANAAALHGWHLGVSAQIAEAIAMVHQSWEVADRLDHRIVGWVVTVVGDSLATLLLDPREGRRWAERELAKPRLAQAPRQRNLLLVYLSHIVALAGELEEALRFLTDAGPESLLLPSEGVAPFLSGDWDRAVAFLTENREHHRGSGAYWYVLFVDFYLAWLRRVQGNDGEAEALGLEAFEICREVKTPAFAMLTIPELVLLYAETGRPGEAQIYLTRCREIMAQGEDWRGLAGTVARAEAAVAAAEGRLMEAEGQFHKAISIFRQYTLPFEEAEALYQWGRALRHASYPGAGEKFDVALQIYRRVGAGEPWLERVLRQKDILRA